MNESTAIARAESSGLEHNGGGQELAVLGGEVSPEVFQARVEREGAMRKILKDYVRSNMKEGHHFATNLGSVALAKPMLLQDGTRNICSLFKLYFLEPKITETWLEGDHYRVRAHVDLCNAANQIIATGDGICSTRETKYAYRKGDRLCPECGGGAIIKGKSQYGGGWVCYANKGGCGAKFPDNDERITSQQLGRIDNPDKADIENTVLKMAIKRAKSAAVCDVPMVSEIFAPEGDEPQAVVQGPKSKVQSPKAEPKQATLVDDDPAAVDKAIAEIGELLKVKCGDGEVVDEEAATEFLKGRNPAVMPLAALEKLLGELRAM